MDRGIRVRFESPTRQLIPPQAVLESLDAIDLADHVVASSGLDDKGAWLQLHLSDPTVELWAPGTNTLALCQTLNLDTQGNPKHLLREIVVTLLMGPIVFEFPSLQELVSAVRIRLNIVQAARKTMLAFETEVAERPADSWIYKEGCGFTLLPQAELIPALIKATQPGEAGALYDFSCYRATEYIILLAIAQELQRVNPALLQELEALWHQRAILSGEFHDVFLREQGSMAQPLPPGYFVPGDRTWFRNPDEASADVAGFEGSWVMYLGNGLFANFWKQNQHYTMTYKCLEIYHWRNGLVSAPDGELCMDERKVEQCVRETQKNPLEVARILALMTRYREPRGIYTEAGGCIDTTREFARWVCPGTADLLLPGR